MLVLATSALLLGGALVSQHVFGLYPCDLCMYQRWPHVAALALGTLALFVSGGGRTTLVVLAALALMGSGAVGAFHAGVEYGWWESPLACSSPTLQGSGDFMSDIMAAPLVRCDVAAWTLFGISLAGYNALISLTAGAFALWLTSRKTA